MLYKRKRLRWHHQVPLCRWQPKAASYRAGEDAGTFPNSGPQIFRNFLPLYDVIPLSSPHRPPHLLKVAMIKRRPRPSWTINHRFSGALSLTHSCPQPSLKSRRSLDQRFSGTFSQPSQDEKPSPWKILWLLLLKLDDGKDQDYIPFPR